MSFHPELLNPRFGGYEVIGCEIKDRDTLYLLAREDVDQMEIHRRGRGGPPEGKKAKRLIGLRLGDPERPVAVAHIQGLGTSRGAMAFATWVCSYWTATRCVRPRKCRIRPAAATWRRSRSRPAEAPLQELDTPSR